MVLKPLVKMILFGIMLALVCPSLGYSRPSRWNNYTPPPPPPLYDYSDAPGYGTAYHTTSEWQWLGDTWNSETSPAYTSGDSSDDGVWWSVDGGSTWGHEDIYAGQDVTFRFDMHRAAYGVHEYDQLKAWIDWNGDYLFDYEGLDSEEIIALKWFKNTIEDGNTQYNDSYWLGLDENSKPNPDAILFKEFFTTVSIPDDISGNFWLRARVSCDHTAFDYTNPYGELWQGEAEDWLLTIFPDPIIIPQSIVPEPATLVLLGFGFIGLAAYGRRMKK